MARSTLFVCLAACLLLGSVLAVYAQEQQEADHPAEAIQQVDVVASDRDDDEVTTTTTMRKPLATKKRAAAANNDDDQQQQQGDAAEEQAPPVLRQPKKKGAKPRTKSSKKRQQQQQQQQQQDQQQDQRPKKSRNAQRIREKIIARRSQQQKVLQQQQQQLQQQQQKPKKRAKSAPVVAANHDAEEEHNDNNNNDNNNNDVDEEDDDEDDNHDGNHNNNNNNNNRQDHQTEHGGADEGEGHNDNTNDASPPGDGTGDGGDHSPRNHAADEQRALKRQAELLLAKEKGRAQSEELKQRDRVRLAGKAMDHLHNAHANTAKEAKSRVQEAQAAFEHAELLIKKAEEAGHKGQLVHEQAVKLAALGDHGHKELAHKLEVQERKYVGEHNKDVKLAKIELEHAQKAHDQAIAAEQEALMLEQKEKQAEMARIKAHGEMQRSHLEQLALQKIHGEDLLRGDGISPHQQAELQRIEMQRNALNHLHQRGRDEMHGVPIPAGVALADGRPKEGIEEYIVTDARHPGDRGNFVECPQYQGQPCGGPHRGVCDRLTGTCSCNDGVGPKGGYFGAACECGWSKSKCNPPECHWCKTMDICVKDQSECMKKPHGRRGVFPEEYDSDDDDDENEPVVINKPKERSESLENEHHHIGLPSAGLHDHARSQRVAPIHQELGELPVSEPEESDSSTNVIAVLCLLLFAVVMIIGAYLGFAPKGKPREDIPMSAVEGGGAVADKSAAGARRRQAARDD